LPTMTSINFSPPGSPAETIPPLIPGGPTSIGDPTRDPSSLPTPSFSQRLTPILTKLAHGSAPFLSTFLVIHLSAPVLANLGGSSLSSQMMILGREYYQTSFGERFLFKLPFTIHVVSGIAKRLIALHRPPRPLKSLLSLSAYVSLLFFFPIHWHTHRAYPAIPSPPIYAVGPSELDYEFVKVGIQTWPWTSWFLYGGLALGVAWHMAEGLNIIYSTWVKGSGVGSKYLNVGGIQVRHRVVGASLAMIPVFSGVWFISREPIRAFTSLASTFQEVYKMSFIYRL